jgi:hypothetical protein
VHRLLDLVRLGILVLFERFVGRISRPQVGSKFVFPLTHRSAPFGSGRLLALFALVRAGLVLGLDAGSLVFGLHLPALIAGRRWSVIAEFLLLAHADSFRKDQKKSVTLLFLGRQA